MPNYNEFEKKLVETDRIPRPDAAQTESALLQLRMDLKQVSEMKKRSRFDQTTAWTRLQSEISEPMSVSSWRALSYFATAVAAIVVTVAFFFSTGSQNSQPGLPTISGAEPGIYATPFYSEEAKAEVIWAEGYRYIPANYTY
ncbi:MAG: hypothetical protein AAF558_13125 [Verrucomicrobiota bacterium]